MTKYSELPRRQSDATVAEQHLAAVGVQAELVLSTELSGHEPSKPAIDRC